MKRDRSDGDPPALRTALAMEARGEWPVPIYPPGVEIQTRDGPKITTGKEPIGFEWGKVRHTPETLRAVWAKWPNAGVGMKLGKDAGSVDIEVDDPERGPETYAEMMGGEEVTTRGWGANRGDHHAFAWDDRLAKYGKAIIKVGGVEIRAGSAEAGGKQYQSVVPPTLKEDGTPRESNGIEELAPLPDSFFAYLDRMFEAERRSKPRPTIPIYQPKPGEWGPAERARAYVFAPGFPDSIEHQRGHDRLYHVACVLVDGFGLTQHEAMTIFRDWNASKAIPPESDAQLDHKLADAIRNHPSPSRFILNQDRTAKEAKKANKGGASFASYASFAGQQRKNPSPNGTSFASFAEDPDGDVPVVVRPWPAIPSEAAWSGLAGEVVEVIAPHTESDPVSILLQLLTGFGSIVGRTAYFLAEADRHYPNLFACLVGQSSKARKGTSWSHVRCVLERTDPEWERGHIVSGLTSGEGLIWAVRDRIMKREPIKDKGRVIDYQEVETDPGVADKRLLCLETEMAGPLKAISREGNTLSAIVRKAWDEGNLRTLTKNNPAVATAAHISIVGHITRDEVSRLLNATEAANGFGNRFLWACVRRSRSLPFGGLAHRIDFDPLCDRLAHAAAMARGRERVERDGPADQLWLEVYDGLAEGRPGLLGAILGRAEAQVMRLALLYALMDAAPEIGRAHLEAAIALWRYCEDSARYIFGESLGDPDADHLYHCLQQSPDGLTQTEITVQVFSRHKSKSEIAGMLGRLMEFGRVFSTVRQTEGRSATVWHARGAKSVPEDESECERSV